MVTTRFFAKQNITRSKLCYRHTSMSSRIIRRRFSRNSIKKKEPNKILLNHTYRFCFTNQIRFGNIPLQELYSVFRDGRCVSPLLESWITHIFPLTRVNGNKDHDHIDAKGRKYDMKNFTKHGLRFSPSNQQGSGRNFDLEAAKEKAMNLIYICCDITLFPNIQIKFVEGESLFERYPSFHIRYKERDSFFSNQPITYPPQK